MKSILFTFLLLVGTVFAQEDKFIGLLKSDAPLKDKADACQELAHIGTGAAVPVLASLLTDEQLSQMARFALESIADPSADAALREALGKLKGRSLVGVIHSLGVRKDTQAVAPLAQFLTDPDPSVAQAAARAMGRMGGAAAPALERAVSGVSPASQLAVCEGLLRCAETMSGAEATAIYDKLRALPNLPHHVRVAALRGAILSRGAHGVPLLAEAIRTESYVPAADANRISMDLPGAEVTKALIGELGGANEDKQILLLQTLALRGDTTAVPALIPLAQTGSVNRRIAAIRSLVQLAHPSSLPILAALVKDPQQTVASAALTGLTGFPGKEAEERILALLQEPEAKIRTMGIEAVGQRCIMSALPTLLKLASDPDAGVARAGFKVLGELGGMEEIPGMVEVMCQTKAVSPAESALEAVCARESDKSLVSDKLLPGFAKAEGEPKLALLRLLGTVGSPKALAAVRGAAAESNPSVKETAQQVLCDWPSAEALADLAKIARETADPKIKQLALGGQVRLIPLQAVADAQKVEQIKQILPALERQEDKRLALAALGNLPTAGSLALIRPYLSGEGLKEEASAAAVAVAEKIVANSPGDVAEAMQQVQTGNKELAERARNVLAKVPKDVIEAGFTSIFNGKDLSGWDGKPGWWTVEDGALTAESTTAKPCAECNYLVWRGGQPANFELIADFRLSGQGNSGIQLRSKALPNWDTSGYQADMSGDGGLVGFVYEHTRGLIAGRGEQVTIGGDGKREVQKLGDAAELLKIYKPEDWNTYRIICRGQEIKLYVNGTLMCQFTDHDEKQAASKGVIALQMHPGPPMKVQFKNIRLKEL